MLRLDGAWLCALSVTSRALYCYLCDTETDGMGMGDCGSGLDGCFRGWIFKVVMCE